MSQSNLWVLSFVLVSAILITFAWMSHSKVDIIYDRGYQLEKQLVVTNNNYVKEQPSCFTVDTECGGTLTFYQRDNETAGQFASRVQAELKDFNANWDGK